MHEKKFVTRVFTAILIGVLAAGNGMPAMAAASGIEKSGPSAECNVTITYVVVNSWSNTFNGSTTLEGPEGEEGKITKDDLKDIPDRYEFVRFDGNTSIVYGSSAEITVVIRLVQFTPPSVEFYGAYEGVSKAEEPVAEDGAEFTIGGPGSDIEVPEGYKLDPELYGETDPIKCKWYNSYTSPIKIKVVAVEEEKAEARLHVDYELADGTWIGEVSLTHLCDSDETEHAFVLGEGKFVIPTVDGVEYEADMEAASDQETTINVPCGEEVRHTIIVKAKKVPSETQEVTVTFVDADGTVKGTAAVTAAAEANRLSTKDLTAPEGYVIVDEEAEIVDGAAAVRVKAKENPAEPTEPVEPTEPAEPTEPTEPAKPIEPVEPVEPTKPTEPAKPAEPVEYANATLKVTYKTAAGTVIGSGDTLTKKGEVGKSAVFTQAELNIPSSYKISGTVADQKVKYGETEEITVTVYGLYTSSGSKSGRSNSGRTSTVKSTAGKSTDGAWRLEQLDGQIKWRYPYMDGTNAAGGWHQLVWKNVSEWYCFDAEGWLLSGWYTDTDGTRYYLHELHDGDFGRMYTGWNLVNGKWEYFNDDAAAGKLGAWVEGREVPADLK